MNMGGNIVGWFQILTCGQDQSGTHGGSIEVCEYEQFDLGRDTELCRYSWHDDLSISRQHLRIHCILYEKHSTAGIPPFVYATDMSSNGTYLKKSNRESTASQGLGIRMGRNRSFLLDAGDELSLSDTVTLVYCPIEPIPLEELTPIQEREKHVFASRYLVTGRLLGRGGFGQVLVGIQQDTQQQLACKIVRLDDKHGKLAAPSLRLPTGRQGNGGGKARKRCPAQVASCFREFDILQDLTHPNIIAIEKVFWSHKTIYMFQELATGGDLFSFLEFNANRLDNGRAASVIYQVLKGIEYLHNQDIVHRDLKPDNILMTSLEFGARVVITDFGNARFLPGKNSQSALQTNKYQRMFSYVGTLEYTAPEIHRKNRTVPAEDGYSKSVDMWSIGAITATILSGEMIFLDTTHPDYNNNPAAVIIGLAAICDLSVLDEDYHPNWSKVGNLPKNFIKRLLVLEEEQRMTASEGLAHPWFSYDRDPENMYAHSVRDWIPCEKNTQIVECMSKCVPNLMNAGKILSRETIARHFTPAQRRRANTPLPSIMDDYSAARFASQVQSCSHDTGAVKYEHQETYELIDSYQYDGHSHDARSQAESQIYNGDGFPSAEQCEYSVRNTSGTYDNKENDDGNSHGSDVSLDHIMNNSSQEDYCIRAKQPQQFSQDAQECVQIHETPLDEQRQYEPGEQVGGYDESYYQFQFPEECLRQPVKDEEHDSVLVEETPPKTYRKHARSVHSALTIYDECLGDDEVHLNTDLFAYGKRRRISPYTH